jgi:hypothetical protein
MHRSMIEKKLLPALSPDALFGKSKLYIQKALSRKDDGDLDEYQLWASLALELLGKSVLAQIHPSLIADPTHFESLFAASGINISTDLKTIGAHTLFKRLQHLVPKFDDKMKTFCNAISQRRNAELHSGETPFRAMRTDAWEAQYWHSAQVILGMKQSSLDDWLGASMAKKPKAFLKHVAEARKQAVLVRLQRARDAFATLKKKDRDRLIFEAASRQAYHYRDLFTVLTDGQWEAECPACGGKAFIAGIKIEEEVTDTYTDEDGAWESVERTLSAEQFHCPVCDLFLDGAEEIEASGLDGEHVETDDREMEYEPDYGND